jgi:uncharacterized protein
MRRAGRLAALALLLATAPAAAETPIPPPPARFVTDQAAFLSPAAAAELDHQLEAYDRGSGHQLLVYIDRTTGGVPIEDWAVRAFQRWRVGRKGIDDGLVLFVFSDDHRVRIEVGYGLEPRVTDALAARIIEERVVPRIRAGDRDGAVRGAVAALMTAIGGQAAGATAPDGAADAPPRRVSGWTIAGGALLLLFFLGFAVTHPALAALFLFSSSRGRGGGWGGGGGFGGGGGGFSGGGGSSGGGGASGSW